MKKILLLIMMMGGLSACGGTTTADVQGYKDATQQTLASVTNHRQRAQALTTQEECIAEERRYDADVRPHVQRMQSLSGGMDGCMRADGHSEWADMGGVCNSMMGELDQHQANGCTSTDPAQNRNEANQHCNAMDDLGHRGQDRANNAGNCGGMMGAGRR